MNLGVVTSPVVVLDLATAETVELPRGTRVVEVRCDDPAVSYRLVSPSATFHDLTVELEGCLRPLVVASEPAEWPPRWVAH